MSYNLHASHGGQENDGKLGAILQLQVPYEKDWQNGEGKVGDDAECTVHICQGHNDGNVETRSFARAIPIMGDRVTLEQRDAKEREASQNRAQ